jgi:hypothetical protein
MQRSAAGSAAATAAASAFGSGRPVAGLLGELRPRQVQLRRCVDMVSWEVMFDRIQDFLDSGPSRRRLKMLESNGNLTLSVTVLREVVALLLVMVDEGDTTADLLLLYLPRVLFLKGLSVDECLQALQDGVKPMPRKVGTPAGVKWERAVRAAVAEGSVRNILQRLDSGPSEVVHQPDPAPVRDLLEKLHPQQRNPGEFQRWKDRIEAVASKPRFQPRDLRRWAFASGMASGGEVGWTGHMVRHLITPDHMLFDAFSAWAARPPSKWTHGKTAAIAARVLTGWLIPRPGKLPRPIAAPSFIRRVAARTMMKLARSSMEKYCVARGQLGLSGEAEVVAYTALANFALRSGGEVAAEDLEASYTNFMRRRVEEGVEQWLALADPVEDREAVEAFIMAWGDYYVADDSYVDGEGGPGSLHMSRVNFLEFPEMLDIAGLAQGDPMSGGLESLTIATHTPQPMAGGMPLTLSNKDDSLRMCGRGKCLPPRLDVSIFGGKYSTSKRAAISSCEEAITVWGRPVGATDKWMQCKRVQVENRLEAIRALALHGPATAIGVLMRLGGPHGLIIHALKGVPLDEYKEEWMPELEQRWADTVVVILGPIEGEWADPEFRRRKVCEEPSPFAASRRAASLACLSGLALAMRGVARLLGHKVAEDLAQTLGGRFLQDHKVPATLAAVEGYVEQVTDGYNRMKQPRTLWRLALERRQELGKLVEDVTRGKDAWTDADRDDTARAALAACVGYPIRLALGITRVRCGWCNVALDDNMYHLNQCGVSIKKEIRHDPFVRDLVTIGQTVGANTELHDERLPFVGGKRPADFTEALPGGLDGAMDVTMVLPDRIAVAAHGKHRKYDAILKESRFRCIPMAFGLNGFVHEEADAVIHRWRGRWARAVTNAGSPAGAAAAHAVNVEVGFAFARRCVRAMKVWDRRMADRMMRRAVCAREVDPSKRRRTPVVGPLAVTRRRPVEMVAGRDVPQAFRREVENRWDLANTPLCGDGAAAGSSPRPAHHVCPRGATVHGGLVVVGGSPLAPARRLG